MSLFIILEIVILLGCGYFFGRLIYLSLKSNSQTIKHTHKMLDMLYELQLRLELHEATMIDYGLIDMGWDELMEELKNSSEEDSLIRIADKLRREGNVIYLNEKDN